MGHDLRTGYLNSQEEIVVAQRSVSCKGVLLRAKLSIQSVTKYCLEKKSNSIATNDIKIFQKMKSKG